MLKLFAEKMWVAFAMQNLLTFFQQKSRILYIESAETVNEMTLNELVKLTTLWTTGPRLLKWSDIHLNFKNLYYYWNPPHLPTIFCSFYIVWATDTIARNVARPTNSQTIRGVSEKQPQWIFSSMTQFRNHWLWKKSIWRTRKGPWSENRLVFVVGI